MLVEIKGILSQLVGGRRERGLDLGKWVRGLDKDVRVFCGVAEG